MKKASTNYKDPFYNNFTGLGKNKKALTRRYASTSPASGRGDHQLTALLIAPFNLGCDLTQ